MRTSFLCPLKVCFGSISLTEWSCLFLFHHILFADWWAADPEDLQVNGGSDENRSFLRSQYFSLNSFIFAFDISQEGNVCMGCLVSMHRFHGWRGCPHASFSPSPSKFRNLDQRMVITAPPFHPSPTSLPEAGHQGPEVPKLGCTAHFPSLPHMMDEGMAPVACTSLRPVGERKGQT